MPSLLESPAPAPEPRGRLVVTVIAALLVGGAGVASAWFAARSEGQDEAAANAAPDVPEKAPARDRCRAGDWTVCVELARGELHAGGHGLGQAEANELLELACEADHAPACRELEATCQRGVGSACFFLGSRAADRDPEAAAELFRRACEADVQEACDAVAGP